MSTHHGPFLVLAALLLGALSGCLNSATPGEGTDLAGERPPQKYEQSIKLGAEAFRQGDVDLALAYAEAAVRLKSRRPEGYALRGATAWRRREAARAHEDFRRAIELDPDNQDAYLYRGAAYLESQADLAVSDASHAIRIKPQDPEAYHLRAQAYLRQEAIESALRDCDRALELRPDFADALHTRGAAHLALANPRRGDPAVITALTQARNDFQTALKLQPQHLPARMSLTIVRDRLAELDRREPKNAPAVTVPVRPVKKSRSVNVP